MILQAGALFLLAGILSGLLFKPGTLLGMSFIVLGAVPFVPLTWVVVGLIIVTIGYLFGTVLRAHIETAVIRAREERF